MPAQALRLFVFARHAESAANARHVISSDPSQPVALTERGQAQARALGVQLANLHLDLAVGTRLLRTQQTIALALAGRPVPVLIEAALDELRAGDLDGAPMDTYWTWKHKHTADEPLPHGESRNDAVRRYASALRRLLARTEPVTLVVLHEMGLRHIAAAAGPGGPGADGAEFGNAVPYLFDERAVRRAAEMLEKGTRSPAPGTR